MADHKNESEIDTNDLIEQRRHKLAVWRQEDKAYPTGFHRNVLAKYLIGSLQGVSLLTLTFKDPNLLQRQSKNLEQWLEAA